MAGAEEPRPAALQMVQAPRPRAVVRCQHCGSENTRFVSSYGRIAYYRCEDCKCPECGHARRTRVLRAS